MLPVVTDIFILHPVKATSWLYNYGGSELEKDTAKKHVELLGRAIDISEGTSPVEEGPFICCRAEGEGT